MLVVVLLVALPFTGMFVMTTDSCGPSNPCNMTPLHVGYIVAWGGMALAVVVAIAVPVRRMLTNKRVIWSVWPLLGIAGVLLAFALGGGIADGVHS